MGEICSRLRYFTSTTIYFSTVVSLGRFCDAFSLISAIQCFILGRDYMEGLVGIQIIPFSWVACVGTMSRELRSAGFLFISPI